MKDCKKRNKKSLFRVNEKWGREGDGEKVINTDGTRLCAIVSPLIIMMVAGWDGDGTGGGNERAKRLLG